MITGISSFQRSRRSPLPTFFLSSQKSIWRLEGKLAFNWNGNNRSAKHSPSRLPSSGGGPVRHQRLFGSLHVSSRLSYRQRRRLIKNIGGPKYWGRTKILGAEQRLAIINGDTCPGCPRFYAYPYRLPYR